MEQMEIDADDGKNVTETEKAENIDIEMSEKDETSGKKCDENFIADIGKLLDELHGKPCEEAATTEDSEKISVDIEDTVEKEAVVVAETESNVNEDSEKETKDEKSTETSKTEVPAQTSEPNNIEPEKDVQIAQIEEILKNLPLEKLLKIKGNLYDSLLKLNAPEDKSASTLKEPVDSAENAKVDEKPSNQESEKSEKKTEESSEKTVKKSDIVEKLETKPEITITLISDKKKEESKAQSNDVILLDDDDDEEEEKAGIQNPEKKTRKRKIIKDCVNPTCPKKSDEYFRAPGFALSHFYVAKKTKRQFICNDCFDNAVQYYEEAASNVLNGVPIYAIKLPERADLVEIVDSDEENSAEGEDSEDDDDFITQESVDILNANFNRILDEIVKKIDPETQQKMAKDYLERKLAYNEAMIEEISGQLKVIERKSLEMYNRLYSVNKTRVSEKPALELIQGIDPYGQPQLMESTQSSNETLIQKRQQINKKNEKQKARKQDLAKQVQQQLPELTINNIQTPKTVQTMTSKESTKIYYAVRTRPLNSWSPCEVLEKIVINKDTVYKVKFLDNKTNIPNTKTVSGKHLAHGTISNRLQIGARVIAHFNRHAGIDVSPGAKKFVPGVIGEKLTTYNKQRYLIFGDDGSVQYMTPDNVRPVVEQSENVWEDVHLNLQQFIHEYLKSQTNKQRPLLNVRKGQRVPTERNGSWKTASVVDIDCSIIKLHFADENAYEWLYRGSKRLSPLFSHSIGSRTQAGFQKKNDPSIEYITIDDDDAASEQQPKTGTRAVARKSTAKPTNQQQQQQQQQKAQTPATGVPPTGKVKILNDNKIYIDDPTKVARLRHFTPRKEIHAKQYGPHDCGPQCIPRNSSNLASYSPLSKPLLLYWERPVVKHKNIKEIMYKAPCGLRLRNMNEVHRFLNISKCSLNVDNFDFDVSIQVLASYDVDKALCGLYIDDITNGKEAMKIPVVNAFDDQQPPFLQYETERIPGEGVNINRDPEFLCCCDCTDDCSDKSKCQCFQMTIAGAKYKNIMEQPEEEISYIYRRLLNIVQTGIYECNSQCKCNSRCLNRVVQLPIQVKLQVFRTKSRGWGLQSLHDIPKGTFVCNYVGSLYTEKHANEVCASDPEGHGDEYFAELDFIETTQVLKDGYESDVVNPDDDDDDDSDSDYKDDEIEEYDKSDVDFVTSANRTSSREIVTRSTSKVSRSNSVTGSEGNGEGAPSNAKDKPGQEKSESDSDESCIEISDDDKDGGKTRKLVSTVPTGKLAPKINQRRFRKLFGPKERVYIMDAKHKGNIGRYFNHSCSPNLFVQNVFVDTHDPRFPWISFFALNPIKAGEELTWNYNYDVGSVPHKVLFCECGSKNCRNRIL